MIKLAKILVEIECNIDEIKSVAGTTPEKIIDLVDNIRIKIRDNGDLGTYVKIRLINYMDGDILLKKYHLGYSSRRLAMELTNFSKLQLNNLYLDLVDFAKNKIDANIN